MMTEAKVLSTILDFTTAASFLMNAAQTGARILTNKRAEGREHFTAEEEAMLEQQNAAADAEFAKVLAAKQAGA